MGKQTGKDVAQCLHLRSAYLDHNGRFILTKCKINNHEITLINSYGPNNDDPDFFCEIIDKSRDLDSMSVIWGGDFNVVLNPAIDKKKGE